MNYTEVKIVTTTAGAEAVTAALEAVTDSFSIEDLKDLTDMTQAKVKRYDYIDEQLFERETSEVDVKFYLECDENNSFKLAEAKRIIETLKQNDAEENFGRLSFESKIVASESWENEWKKYFKAFDVGEKLMVYPAWEPCPEPRGRVALCVNPGASFGTGSHATTFLCLQELTKMELDGKKVLDVGCGSGILATAALLLGAQTALAVDVEDDAVRGTRENMRANGISSDRFCAVKGDFLADRELENRIFAQKYDLITANIVSDVLMPMAKSLIDGLAEGGELLLSGIICERAREVAAVYLALGANITAEIEREGWTMIRITKSQKSRT